MNERYLDDNFYTDFIKEMIQKKFWKLGVYGDILDFESFETKNFYLMNSDDLDFVEIHITYTERNMKLTREFKSNSTAITISDSYKNRVKQENRLKNIDDILED